MQRAAALISIAAMGALLAIQVDADRRVLAATTLGERLASGSLTAVELALAWSAIGVLLYAVARRRRA